LARARLDEHFTVERQLLNQLARDIDESLRMEMPIAQPPSAAPQNNTELF
jgi:hypothetical protein